MKILPSPFQGSQPAQLCNGVLRHGECHILYPLWSWLYVPEHRRNRHRSMLRRKLLRAWCHGVHQMSGRLRVSGDQHESDDRLCAGGILRGGTDRVYPLPCRIVSWFLMGWFLCSYVVWSHFIWYMCNYFFFHIYLRYLTYLSFCVCITCKEDYVNIFHSWYHVSSLSIQNVFLWNVHDHF